jgi:transposase-like protein
MRASRSDTFQKWRGLVERQRSSGLSVAKFCARHGIAAPSLYAWRRRLAATPAFVEAKLAGVPGPEPSGMVEVRLCGGRRLLVRREGFDRELLVEVVAALEGLGRGREVSS